MELLAVSAEGKDYEDALANCFVKVVDVCGKPNAQVFRREEGEEPIILVDWVLETARASVSLGGASVHIEAEFFLCGSDE